MPDKFYPPTIDHLLKIILSDLETKNTIFDIPRQLFFDPSKNQHLHTEKFGKLLHNPVGLAAGPHTQLAQNIIAGWLCGARFIELKTVQTLDKLVVSKPCIDMQDEGYNCEWSQELTIEESYDQYLNAWIIIHMLNYLLFGSKREMPPLGTIFDMSIGYNIEGITKYNVQWYLRKMNNCKEEKDLKISLLSPIYPDIKFIQIPDIISNSVTLSTMHGCPPREIEYIGKYFMLEKNLHTTIKLNPTLLGEESVKAIINRELEYNIEIPKSTFKNDLSYPDAIRIIESLSKTSIELGLFFGIKLTNTLECLNQKNILPKREQKIYMSGKALHPIAVNLAAKLQMKFDGQLNISFSGGADCFNIPNLIQCGFSPITMCSDLLKPGGYARLAQYFTNLSIAFNKKSAPNIPAFIKNGNKISDIKEAALDQLKNYAISVLTNPDYRKKKLFDSSIKTSRELGHFDCIHAPCVDTCPTNQDIPDYLWFTEKNDLTKAMIAILRTNPFPSVMGTICDHICQLKCTRINYDDPLLIREIKRYVAENAPDVQIKTEKITRNGQKAAIIGAGPAGLSCAWFLNLAGFDVTVYEAKEKSGGMVSGAIPGFRISDQTIEKDIERIRNAGINFQFGYKIDRKRFKELKAKNKAIFVASGAQKASLLNIPDIDAKGILNPLEFLHQAREGKQLSLGKNVAIIGGGNTAMDAARTAFRLVGKDGTVTIIYRRTIKEMPADKGEIQAVLDEGITILELMSPKRIITKNNQATGIECMMMTLKDTDQSGRPKPVEISKTEFVLAFDTIIPAVGQELAIDFVDHDLLKTNHDSYQTQIEKVFIGGDAMRGASTAINAIGDGRKAAVEILRKTKFEGKEYFITKEKQVDIQQLKLRKATRQFAIKPVETPADMRRNFNLITATLKRDEAVKEASRCLQCDVICNVCISVCPNHSNFGYEVPEIPTKVIKVKVKGGQVKTSESKTFSVFQKYQVLNIADWCNQCGNCDTFCPSAGAPYRDKPRLFLNNLTFSKSPDGYLLKDEGDGNKSLSMKTKNSSATLSENWDAYIFENDHCMIVLDKNTLDVKQFEWMGDDDAEIELPEIPQMKILLEATRNLI